MKQPSGTIPLLAIAASFAIAAAAFPARAAGILKQFGSFKSVNAVVPLGGSLWLATSGGVVRYDLASGSSKTFTEVSDIPDLNVTAAVKDDNGDLWFGTGSGYLIKCHPQTATFTSYNALTVSNWRILCMNRSGNFLFIGTTSGLSIFNIARLSMQNAKQFSTSTSTAVSEIRIFGDTIAVALPDGLAYMAAPDFANAIFSDPSVWKLLPASDPVGIVRRNDSLFASPRKTAQFGAAQVQFGGTDSVEGLWLNNVLVHLFPSAVACATPVSDTQIAVGTKSSFWYLCNPAKQVFTPESLDGPEDSYIKGCAMDKDGVLWFVPYDMTNGIGTFDGRQWSSLTYNNTPGLPPMSSGPFICKNAIMVTSKNDVWVSTFAYGSLWLNRETGLWSSYEDGASPYYRDASPIVRFDEKAGLWWTFVSSTCEDSLGYIWVANNTPYNGNFLHVRKPRDNSPSAWRSFNFSLVQDQDYPRFIGPIASNQNKAYNTQYVYLGFGLKADMSGGGMAILSYPSTNSPVDTLTPVQFQKYAEVMSASGFAVVNDTLVWVAADDGIYKITNNNISTLTKISKITSTGLFEAIAVGANGRPVFCKDKDLYSYNDDDSSLTNLTKCGTLSTPVNWISFDPATGVYWVATSSCMYRFQSGDAATAQSDASAGSIDVFPNPMSRISFINNHPIRFARLNSQSPHVRIYDASGTLVLNLTGQNTTIINWNGKNKADRFVVPGVYFYQANSANGKSCKGKIYVLP
jgi:hypothetical protein